MKVHKDIKNIMPYEKIKQLQKQIVRWFEQAILSFLAVVLLFLIVNGALLFATVVLFVFLFFFGIAKNNILLSKIILWLTKKRIEKFKTAIQKKYNIEVIEINYDYDFSFITLRITDTDLYTSNDFQNFLAEYQTKNKINDIVVICHNAKVKKEDQVEI